MKDPPEMTDAEMRRRMAREVLKATYARLHGRGARSRWALIHKTGELFKTMPVIEGAAPGARQRGRGQHQRSARLRRSRFAGWMLRLRVVPDLPDRPGPTRRR